MRRTLSRSPRTPLECRELTESRFEKPALLFALLFFGSVAVFLGAFIWFLFFFESQNYLG
jgi:hypothetical protein